jgi:hypothetical protein
MKLWHGGAPFRRVGEKLLPPSTTRIIETSGAQSQAQGFDEFAYRPDRIYVTTSIDLATAFAANWNARNPRQTGTLYEIEVDDDLLEPDHDLLSSPGLAFQAPEGIVIGIRRTMIKKSPKYAAVIRNAYRQNEAAKAAKQPE